MKPQVFTEKEQLKSIEVISSRTSEKYVPILSSEIVDILSPDFEFINCTKFSPAHSQHQITLKYNESVITIINSYDGSKAFRMYYTSNNFRIPLNIGKQVHRGKVASGMVDSIKINKEDIITSIQHANTTVEKLKSTPVLDNTQNQIIDIIFYRIKNRSNFVSLEVPEPVSSLTNLYDFINYYMSSYIQGTYDIEVKNKKGVSKFRKGRRIKSHFTRIYTMNIVYKYIIENFPQILI